MHLQFLQPGSFIQFDGGGGFCKCLQRSDEIARGGDGKMRQQGGAIGPLLEKHQPQRILAIDMDGVTPDNAKDAYLQLVHGEG